MIVILGGNGFIGSTLDRYFQAVGEQTAVFSRKEVDYTDLDTLVGQLRRLKPRFLVNAAGYTGKPNVDACEENKAACLAGNAVLPGIVRAACEEVGLPWGHVSSGCLYSGRPGPDRGFREDDPPNFSFRSGPCSFYSGSKALGEEILEDAERCYIWRIRIPFSHVDSPRNYLSKLLQYDRLLDVENSLTRLEDFVRVAHEFSRKEFPAGIYNVSNGGSITTREVVRLIQKYLRPEKEFSFFDDESEFMKTAARTPRSSCVLDNGKLVGSGIAIPPVHEALRDALSRWQ